MRFMCSFTLFIFTKWQHKLGREGSAEQAAQSLWKALCLFCPCGV